MIKPKNKYTLEVLHKESNIYPVSKLINFNHLKGALSICKIKVRFFGGDYGQRNLNKKLKEGAGTGSFIKFRDGNKFQYFLMTCEHVIQKEIIEKDDEELEFFYHLESISRKITLNRDERFIKEYMQNGIDVTLVEIFQEEVPWQYFLEPEYSCLDGFDQYEGKNIIIHQFPRGLEQSFSEYKIDKCIGNKLYYKVSTQKGSSGSPIILEGSQNILAVHRGGDDDHNDANFILDIINDEERINYKGYRAESYKNINSITDKQILIQKTKYRYFFKKIPYVIKLYYDEKDNNLIFSIENNVTGNLYEYTEVIDSFMIINNAEVIQDQFDLFEKAIYKGEIIEDPDQSICIVQDNKDDIILKRYPSLYTRNKFEQKIRPSNHRKYIKIDPYLSNRNTPETEITKISCEFYVGLEKKLLSDFLKISYRPYSQGFPLHIKKYRSLEKLNIMNNYEKENVFENFNKYRENNKIEDKQTKTESYTKKENSDTCFIY